MVFRENIFLSMQQTTAWKLSLECRLRIQKQKKMKARGSTDPKIDAAVCEFLNIDKFIAKEDKEAIDKIIAQKDSKK